MHLHGLTLATQRRHTMCLVRVDPDEAGVIDAWYTPSRDEAQRDDEESHQAWLLALWLCDGDREAAWRRYMDETLGEMLDAR